MEIRTLRFPSWAKITTVAIVTALGLFLLRTMGSLLNPFIWAIITAYLLSPLVRILTRRSRIRRFWWVLLLYIITGFLLFAAFNFIWPRLVAQFTDLQAAVPQFAQQTSSWIEKRGRLSFGGFVLDLRPAE